MSLRTYNACHHAVSPQHGNPPNSFLDQLIDAINPLSDEVFAENDRHDIYSVMVGALGPYDGLLHRKAVMCEVLRVQAAFESDWNWNEGVDMNNHHSMTHIEGQETGAFQVSADSMVFDMSLRDCVDRAVGSHDPLAFINAMKINHALAVEYCARLLRFNTTWCGTINDHSQVIAHVRRDAVGEFQTFLQTDHAPTAAPPATPSPTAPMGAPSGATKGDGHGSSNSHVKPQIKQFIESPNHSSRNGATIQMVVLHCTEASLQGTLAEFQNGDPSGRQVSAHYVIDKNGDIYQMVRDSDRANHCRGANQNSIGIEHVAQPNETLTDDQAKSSAALIAWLLEQYDVTAANVYGHDFTPGYNLPGGTSCPDKLFGPQHSQATVAAWVNKNVVT